MNKLIKFQLSSAQDPQFFNSSCSTAWVLIYKHVKKTHNKQYYLLNLCLVSPWCVLSLEYVSSTVPFHSICQSCITGPQKSMKCHDGHGHFGEVTKSFLDRKKKFFKWLPAKFDKKKPLPDENLYLSCSSQPPDETIFSSGVSRITVADELIEMVQQIIVPEEGDRFFFSYFTTKRLG